MINIEEEIKSKDQLIINLQKKINEYENKLKIQKDECKLIKVRENRLLRRLRKTTEIIQLILIKLCQKFKTQERKK